MGKRIPHNKIILDDYQIGQIEKLAGLGLSMKNVSDILGFSKDTLERMIHEEEAVAAAVNKGRAQAIQKVADTAYRMASEGRCPTMTIFWLRCRAGKDWKPEPMVEESQIDVESIEKSVTETEG